MILALVEETPDVTLEELRAALAARGVSVGYGTLWRFVDRRRIPLKKGDYVSCKPGEKGLDSRA